MFHPKWLKFNQHLYIFEKWKQDNTLKIQGTGNEYGVSCTRKKKEWFVQIICH